MMADLPYLTCPVDLTRFRAEGVHSDGSPHGECPCCHGHFYGDDSL